MRHILFIHSSIGGHSLLLPLLVAIMSNVPVIIAKVYKYLFDVHTEPSMWNYGGVQCKGWKLRKDWSKYAIHMYKSAINPYKQYKGSEKEKNASG